MAKTSNNKELYFSTASIGTSFWYDYDKVPYPYLRRMERPMIEKVIFNPPATIVFWSDNTKTVVKCQEGDEWDAEKGLAMAVAKKYFGNKGNYNNEFNKWLCDDGLTAEGLKDIFDRMAERLRAIAREVV